MPDLRAAILARCDELERLARAAGDSEHWTADGGSVHRGHPADEVIDYAHGGIADHIAAWDPAAVLELVAGAREMCEEHVPTLENSQTGRAYCRGCERTPDGCPSLRITARMLGVSLETP